MHRLEVLSEEGFGFKQFIQENTQRPNVTCTCPLPKLGQITVRIIHLCSEHGEEVAYSSQLCIGISPLRSDVTEFLFVVSFFVYVRHQVIEEAQEERKDEVYVKIRCDRHEHTVHKTNGSTNSVKTSDDVDDLVAHLMHFVDWNVFPT